MNYFIFRKTYRNKQLIEKLFMFILIFILTIIKTDY